MIRSGVLGDAAWARVEPLLPPAKGLMGRPSRPHRPVVEGMIYRARTGVPWRDLPAEFGAWQTVHRRFQRWSVDGTLDRVLAELVADADASGELERAVSVDFSSGVDDYNGALCPHGRMRIAVGSVR